MLELIKQEWKKILRMRAVPLLLFVMLFITLFSYADRLLPENTYPLRAYREAHKVLDGLSLEKQLEELERMEQESRTMLRSQTLPEGAFTEYYWHEFRLYEQLISELEQVTGYQRYLTGVEKNAQKTLNSTLHQRQESALREAEKIIKDFAVMEGVQAELLPTKGMDLFFEMDLQDFVLVLAVFLLAASLATVELEEGTLQLLRCTNVGRKRVVYAKYLAGCGLLAAYWLLIWGSKLLATVGIYGAEALSGSIVSLQDSYGCTLPITIGQGVALFFAGKLLAVLTLFSFLFLLALCLRQAWKIYLFAGGPVALFWAAYRLIDEQSWLAGIKWINPVAFFDTKTLLLRYKNLSFFGYPVSYRNWMLVICAVIILFSLLLLGKAFLGMQIGKNTGGNGKVFALAERMAAVITGHYSLGGFELRKWSFYQSGGTICVMLAAIMLFTYSPVADQVYTEEEIYYRHYVKEMSGIWTDEKMTVLYEEQEKLQGYRDILRSGEEPGMGMINFYQQQLKRESGLQKAIQYGEYLREKGEGTFIYEQGYERFFGKLQPMNLFLYRCLSLAIMVFLTVQMYGVERRTGMNRLIRISAVGERKIRRYKAANTLLVGILVFVIVFVPWFYNVFSVYGTNGINAPAYCLWKLGIAPDAPAFVTVGVMLVVYYGAHLLYLWLIGFVSGYVAERVKNQMVASLAAFGLGMLPLLFGMN